MEYTKNYHLPQWVRSDRIMMDDFNAAMAGIEQGLTQGKTERQTLAEQIRLAEAGTSAGAQTALRNGLFRLAYNRWHYLAPLETTPRQIGFFRQGFARDEKGPTGGMLQLDDRLWTTYSDGVLTSENICPSVKALTAISFDKGTDTCSFTFTPPYTGYLNAFYLSGNYDARSSSTSNTGAAKLRLYDDASGALLLERDVSFRIKAGTSGAGSYRMSVDSPVSGKKKYRVEVQITVLDVKCSYLMDASLTSPKCFDVKGRDQADTAFTYRFQLDEASQGGLVLVHYTATGSGGVTLGWQGETLSPYKIRTVTYRGQTVKEAEFRLNKAVPADSTATLIAHCEKDKEFSLYQWGGMLV